MTRLLTVAALLLFAGIIRAQDDFATPQELADPNGAFVMVDDVSVYYTSAGDPTDPTVIFLHGFGGSTFTWRDTLTPVAEAGFYALALDLPPFGLSDKDTSLDYSRAGMADTVAGFMDALDIDTATMVGHSMGGGVTAQFAVTYPDKIEKLVFVAGGVFDALDDRTEANSQNEAGGSPLGLLAQIDPDAPAAALLLRALVTRDFFADTLRSAYYDDDAVTEAAIDGYARLLQIEDAPAGFLAYTLADQRDPITLAELAQATESIPVLIQWGIEDTWVPLQLGQIMAERLTDARFVTYEATGHLPMEENTAAFNADLIAFLGD